MKMLGPDEFRRSVVARRNLHMTPRVVTEEEYRDILLVMLAQPPDDPVWGYDIAALESTVIQSGMTLPVLRISSRHYCDYCGEVATYCYREGQGTGHSEHVCACEKHQESNE